MRIDYVQKNYQMSAKLEDIIGKKLGKLGKYFEEDTPVKVELKKKNEDVFKMEVTVSLGQTFVRAETESDNMYANIDILLPKIEKQLLKHKDKLQKKLKTGAFKENSFLFFDSVPLNSKTNAIAKIKKFNLSEMAIEDAIDEMDMIAHDFYLFVDEQTHLTSVVYRRDDGTVGLLQAL